RPAVSFASRSPRPRLREHKAMEDLLLLLFDDEPSTLSVRRFLTHDALSEPFVAEVWARSEQPSIDLEGLVGHKALFIAAKGVLPDRRIVFDGICEHAELLQAEPTGLSTYFVRVVPRMWLMTQRRGYRIFQHLTAPDIVKKLLAEWGVDA